MNSYDSSWLIQIAEMANHVARTEGMSVAKAMKDLLDAVERKELTATLYRPHEKWADGGTENGAPMKDGLAVWRSLSALTSKRHTSAKADWDLPPAASTYHLLADDVADYAARCAISPLTAQALRELAIERKPRLGLALPAVEPEPDRTEPVNPAPATDHAAQPAGQPIAPAAQAAPNPAPAAKRKARRDLMTPVIETAQRECKDPHDTAQVWPVLVRMSKEKRGPMIGVTEDGIQWIDGSDEHKILGIAALRDRLSRDRSRAETR